MYIFRNAAKNLLRNKGRNILIGVIMSVMLTAAAISMMINTTTNEIVTDYKTQFGSKVVINPDIDKLMNQSNGMLGDLPELTYEQKMAFAESEYLKETLFTGYYPGYNDRLSAVGSDAEQEDGNQSGTVIENEVIQSSDDRYHHSNLTLMGYSDYSQLTDFTEGIRKISSGEMFRADNECIISEDFAKLNDLKVGDEIEVKDCEKSVDILTMKLKIAGIYYDAAPATLEGLPVGFGPNRRNEVLVNVNTLAKGRDVLEQEGSEPEFIDIEPTYVLKNPDLLADFDTEVRQKGLDDIFKVSTDASGYNQIVKPVEGVADTSVMFLILVLVIGGIVLVLVSTLSIRERKYEIGVLRAMGMKKSAVARGLIYEALITIAICLVVGLSIGNVGARTVADGMLKHQIEVTSPVDDLQNSGSAIAIGGFGSDASEAEPLTELNVSLTFDAFAGVAGIALLLGLLSVATGLVYILRYEPMKILSERN
jgi:putative ABC transport system permease protein